MIGGLSFWKSPGAQATLQACPKPGRSTTGLAIKHRKKRMTPNTTWITGDEQQANLLAYSGPGSAETTEYHRRKADT
ncbi:hypothetical protein PSPTOT1_4948 [Pseudomonas syringae pv. tomato T1]|nr:hypothetical protein PSPTOT1_4948 [Pseudomonas syringae pv. tomato T1]